MTFDPSIRFDPINAISGRWESLKDIVGIMRMRRPKVLSGMAISEVRNRSPTLQWDNQFGQTKGSAQIHVLTLLRERTRDSVRRGSLVGNALREEEEEKEEKGKKGEEELPGLVQACTKEMKIENVASTVARMALDLDTGSYAIIGIVLEE
ncbi:hypothetical protein BJV77DRAFT_965171 [Russula vinacea]|nr:hypothetical protein BJV77DRAFT_965171 [Russula vinacea]